MPQGSKSAYTSKQRRKAHHIEESAKERGTSQKEAERIGWATVNKQDGGGKKKGSGSGASGPGSGGRAASGGSKGPSSGKSDSKGSSSRKGKDDP